MSCMSGHIKVDLKSKRSTHSLLVAGPGMFQMLEEDSSILEGAYILFDTESHIWIRIRSGKASPTTIADRLYIGHKKEARTSSKGLYGLENWLKSQGKRISRS